MKFQEFGETQSKNIYIFFLQKHDISVHGSEHSHGSGESHGGHGPMMEAFEKAIYPLEVMLGACCPECEIGSPNEDW